MAQAAELVKLSFAKIALSAVELGCCWDRSKEACWKAPPGEV